MADGARDLEVRKVALPPGRGQLPQLSEARVKELARYLASEPLNDTGAGNRLIAAHGAHLIYIQGRGWAVWDGHRFSFARGHLGAQKLAKDLHRLLKAEGEHMASDAERKVREKFATDLGNVSRMSAALAAATDCCDKSMGDLDAEPLHFVVLNGTVDLSAAYRWQRPDGATEEEELAARASWLIDTDRASCPTRVAGVAYDHAADCPGWRAFLELILPDPAERAALQRLLGYCLSGDNPEAACVILRGPGGNGKSTLLNALRHVLGQLHGYAEGCNIEMFITTPQRQQNAHAADEIDLPGARVYIASEPSARDVLDMKKIKSLTGGDARKSRGAYEKASFSWVPRGVPILSVNRTPKLKDGDDGTRRRLIFVPLEVNLKQLPPEARRPAYEVEAELRAEGAGVLNWLLDGWRDYKAQGLAVPERWTALRDRLLEGADPVAKFLAEMTEAGPEGERPQARIPRADFNCVYEAWATAEGAAAWSSNSVREAMTEAGHVARKMDGIFCWPGLRWTRDALPFVERTLDRKVSPPQAAPPPPSPPADPPPF